MIFKNLCKWIVITGTLLIWIVKFGIRPYYSGGPFTTFLLGVAPNLVGSFLIPFAAFWFFCGKENLLARIFRIQSVNDLRNVCFIGFVMLLINEYLQLIPIFARTFDYFDLLFSIVGLTTSYFIFSTSYNRFTYRYYAS